MNFYDYHQPGEDLDAPAVYLAAKDLVDNGFHIIPLKKGTKEPANIRSVYEIISNPIHAKNMDYYFKDRDVDLGIILDHTMEFIDIDPKNKSGVETAVLKAIRSGWPDLFDKLVIDFTPSGGCHIIYRAEITGGASVLAKVKSSPNPLAIIERISRHTKQYIKISPSEGYSLKQGNPFTIPMLTAEERNFLGAICASFNEVHKPEVPRKEADRPDSPWSVYNSTHDWKYTRNELIDRGWSVYRETDDKVLIRRPGNTPQAYSGVIFKDTNILYLFTPSTEFENEKPYSPFGVYCLLNHDNNVALAIKTLAAAGCGKNIYDEGQFWKREKNKIKIKYTDLLSWLHSIGYRVYDKTVVQVIDNIVRVSDENAMKRAFLNEVEFEIQDEMYERVSSIFSEGGGLMAMLKDLDNNFITDTKDATWLFFQNLALKITAYKYEPYEYKALDGYIWESSIIDREFYETDFSDCDADRFISILGGENTPQLREILGYCISKYKDPLNPRAVILMEDIEADNEGEAQGGSGKSLCLQFIKQFRKSCDFDGQNFKPSETFAFQNIDPDTAVIIIDDVPKGFRFSSLFSIITGQLMVNKKNRDQIIIPFDRSPKILITSNYSIGGLDLSSKRRKYEFPVVKYFGEEIEPVDTFGRQFFSDWDAAEWLRFDNFIADCCRKYLADNNKRKIGVITENSSERSLIANTSRDFVDYMDGQLSINFFEFAPLVLKNKQVTYPDGTTISNAVNMETFTRMEEDPDYYITVTKERFFEVILKKAPSKYLTTTRLTQWLRRWAEFRGVNLDTSYKRQASGDRCYRFISWPAQPVSFPLSSDNKTGNGWVKNPEWE